MGVDNKIIIYKSLTKIKNYGEKMKSKILKSNFNKNYEIC